MSAAAREAPGREEMITMMYRYGSGMSGWGYALTTVSLILFWGAVIFGIATGPPSSPRFLLAGLLDVSAPRLRLAGG